MLDIQTALLIDARFSCVCHLFSFRFLIKQKKGTFVLCKKVSILQQSVN